MRVSAAVNAASSSGWDAAGARCAVSSAARLAPRAAWAAPELLGRSGMTPLRRGEPHREGALALGQAGPLDPQSLGGGALRSERALQLRRSGSQLVNARLLVGPLPLGGGHREARLRD